MEILLKGFRVLILRMGMLRVFRVCVDRSLRKVEINVVGEPCEVSQVVLAILISLVLISESESGGHVDSY